MKKTKTISLIALISLFAMVSCGEVSSSPSGSLPIDPDSSNTSDTSSTPDSTEEPPISSDSTIDPPDSSTSPVNPGVDPSALLQRAVQQDYNSMLVSAYAMGEYGESMDSIIHADDYQVLQYYYGDEIRYQYFHDYNDESYQWFEASNAKERSGWLKEGYGGAPVGIGNANVLDGRELVSFVAKHIDDVYYTNGIYMIVDDAAIQEAYEEIFAWAPDIASDTLAFLIDSTTGNFTKFQWFHSKVDVEDNVVLVQFDSVGSTQFTGELPDAPNSSNTLEYWQYKGFSGPQIEVYPKSITLTPDPDALVEDNKYTLEIEETLGLTYAIEWDVPEDVEEERWIKVQKVTFQSSNDNVATVGYDSLQGSLLVTANAKGDADIYASFTAKDLTTKESNHIPVHVNPLADQNLEGAVYNFAYDAISNGAITARNLITGKRLPFEITGNEGVSVVTGRNNSLYAEKSVLVLQTGRQETLNTEFAADAALTYDFDDQQVSGISLYYGQIYSISENSALKKATIQTSDDGETWVEACDITEEIKSKISEENEKLLERSFAPASKVRIVLEGNMIGKSFEMSFVNTAFIADENCHDHYSPDAVPVTSVSISTKDNLKSVKLNETLKFFADVKPSTATSDELVWETSNPEIATIDADGVLHPVAVGTVIVTATSHHGPTEDPIVSNSIQIEVKDIDRVADDVKMTWYNDDLMITVTDTEAVITFETASGTDKITLPYSGKSDRYDVFGTYTDRGTPSYFMIKKNFSFDNQADFVINVVGEKGLTYKANTITDTDALMKYVQATSMSASYSNCFVNREASISAQFFGDKGVAANAQNWSIIECSDPEVIDVYNADLGGYGSDYGLSYSEVSKENKTIKGLKEGMATLSIESEEGLTCELEVIVTKKLVTAIKVTAETTSIFVGSTTKAKASITPEDADNTAVTWSSSDTSIATVSSDGTITGVGAGEVTIRATAKDGSGAYGEIKINVIQKAAGTIADHVGTWEDNDGLISLVINPDGTILFTEYLVNYLMGEEFTEYDYADNVLTLYYEMIGTTYRIEFNGDGTATIFVDGEDYGLISLAGA